MKPAAFSMKLPALVAASVLSWALAQAPPPSGVTIRTTTTLVQVGVVALDTKGRPVEGLKKDDFEVSDNGKPQSIAVFYGERIGGGVATPPAPVSPFAPSAPSAPSGPFTNQLSESPAARGSYSVILLDWSNTAFDNIASARDQARVALTRLSPEQPVGLYSFDRFGLQVVNEVGSSRAAILKSIKTLIGKPSPCYQARLSILDGKFDDSMTNCGGDDPLAREVVTFYVGQRTRATLGVFEAISAHLAGLPGRKSLIWISAGFPRQIELRRVGPMSISGSSPGGNYFSNDAAIDRAMQKLNNADVALYPVDARGLTTRDPRRNPDSDTWPVMDEFAKRTGGKSFYGDNGLDVGIEAAIEDVQASYTLGFYAPRDSSRAGFHKLSVRVLLPGVTLRYKEGYSVDAPGKITKENQKEAVAEALTALMDATSIPIDVEATRQKNTLHLRVSLRPDALALAQKGDRWQGAVEFITRFAKEDGNEAAPPISKRIELSLTQGTYDAGQRDGLVFSRTLEAPPGAASLRVLVRNDPSGEIGTLTIPVKAIAAVLQQ